ncbi:protein containing Peptidase S16, lon, partial [mine drainage metagenome]
CKDLVEIPDNIKGRLELHPVRWIDQVLALALEREPVPLPEAGAGESIPPVPAAATPLTPHGEVVVTPAGITH